jgi:hypothetical protein
VFEPHRRGPQEPPAADPQRGPPPQPQRIGERVGKAGRIRRVRAVQRDPQPAAVARPWPAGNEVGQQLDQRFG